VKFDRLSRALRSKEDAYRPTLPSPPEVGPFRRSNWRSPLRGPWLSSMLSLALLVLLALVTVTGFLSHAAYDPRLGDNATSPLLKDLYFFSWPTRPSWLYAFTQGLHVVAGLALIPVLLAKLWAVIPKLYERPAVASISHGLERVSLAVLVGSALFEVGTGVINIQYWYTGLGFNFTPVHYAVALVFVAALVLHVLLKLPAMLAAFAEDGFLRPLKEGRAATRAPVPDRSLSVASSPAEPTVSRRGMLGAVGLGALTLAGLTAGQSLVGGYLRGTALLAPRGRSYGRGPNDFQVNTTARAAGIGTSATDGSWRLAVRGRSELSFSRDELLGFPLATEDLPIACVEGWSTLETWTGLRLRDLARMSGALDAEELVVQSLQRGSPYARVSLSPGKFRDPRALLALRVNGADLSPDHGYPARIIVPALPGVHNTKWVASLTFRTT
jgi:DMSO/TMAO reductase YedYZ molybdopterin-dependent catalytic subunit